MVQTDTVVRPEVRLHGCPVDGGTLFRDYAHRNIVFRCVACGSTFDQDDAEVAGPTA